MISKRIKELRTEKNLTQKELANLLSLTPKMISFYELGQRTPPSDIILKLAEIFNVSTDYLLGRESDEYDKLSNENLPKLNKKDKKDISKILDALVNDLAGKEAVAFYNGDEELDDETRALIAQSLKVSAVIAKQKAKEKFTPKKYKKNDNE
ncbi:helix-turn-helix domain-containing protein [Pectinatus sottacetonis]|uniref:helix-turn-helix domain-containing protein n=1 Tax=Pectinatus sottacetonis TaxID=1002795 RepID=UPI0018C7E497|nr:helix-turn-helix transcriptional regulator [Pectinatus sottacetonis]